MIAAVLMLCNLKIHIFVIGNFTSSFVVLTYKLAYFDFTYFDFTKLYLKRFVYEDEGNQSWKRFFCETSDIGDQTADIKRN